MVDKKHVEVNGKTIDTNDGSLICSNHDFITKNVCYVIHTHHRTASFTAYLYKLFLCLLVICDQVAITNVFGDKVELFFGRNASMGHHCYMITHIDEFFKQNCKFNQITNYSSWNSNVIMYSLYFWTYLKMFKIKE